MPLRRREREALARAERDETIIRDWLAGATQQTLADEHGITTTRIRQIVQARGGRVQRVIVAPEDGDAPAGDRGDAAAKVTPAQSRKGGRRGG